MFLLFFLQALAQMMTCPPYAPLCGVLTIESGFGPNAYKHPSPGLHGLWPETGAYGTSACVAPTNTTFDVSDMPRACAYVNEASEDYAFARHEWAKHGLCAGGPGPSSAYFAQACALAAQVLLNLTPASSSWQEMQQAASQSAFLWQISQPDKQLLFSVCNDAGAAADGGWRFCKLT